MYMYHHNHVYGVPLYHVYSTLRNNIEIAELNTAIFTMDSSGDCFLFNTFKGYRCMVS